VNEKQHKGRAPMDVLSVMTRFGRMVQEDREGGSYDWEVDMARATLRVAELIQAANALELTFEEADGTPAHWRMNVSGIGRFLRALRACQPLQTPPVF
jgi:hypothetical protein